MSQKSSSIQPSRLAGRSRLALLGITLAAALSATACSPEDFLYFFFGAKIQEDFKANEYSLVWLQAVTKDFELDCSTSNVTVKVTPVAGAPLPNEIRTAFSFFDGETDQRTDTFLTLRRPAGQTYYFGSRDDRVGKPPGACPQRLFTHQDQFGLYLNPSARIPIGSRVDVIAVVRPVVELQKCKEEVVPTSKVVNRAQWIKRPGQSTAIPSANTAVMGVKVHCVQTSNGEQGTLRVIYTDGTREIIGISCKG